jgi:hypothetical protein
MEKVVSFHQQTLVGGFNPSEKSDFVKWDDYSSQYFHGKSCFPAMFQSPPTRQSFLKISNI